MHGATFFGQSFAPGIFMVPLLFIVWPLVIWQWRRVPRGNLVSEVFGSVPRWMKGLTLGLILYSFVNFFACMAQLDGGVPIRRPDGALVIQNHEQIVRTLTPEAYRQALAVQTRMLSGHLLAFYGLAVIALQAFWIKTGTGMAGAKLPPASP